MQFNVTHEAQTQENYTERPFILAGLGLLFADGRRVHRKLPRLAVGQRISPESDSAFLSINKYHGYRNQPVFPVRSRSYGCRPSREPFGALGLSVLGHRLYGAHRFFFGKPLTGALWFFTGGLLLIGWIVDIVLIPSMAKDADHRYPDGRYDYNIAWLLLVFLGIFGVHRFYLGKFVTGIIYLCTGGLFGIGYVYDLLTMNEQIAEIQ